jgi:histidinol-phosphatase (PHP family)
MIDYHIHLERGKYTDSWFDRFIKVGKERGIEEFGFVEHLYIFTEASHLLYQNEHVLSMQNKSIDEYFDFLRSKQAGNNIKIGIEVDYIEEREDQIYSFVKDLDVDFLIGSVHYLKDWAFDLDKNWPTDNYEKVYCEYYETLLKLAKSNIFDILGHPGNIAYFGYGPSKEIEEDIVKDFYEKLAKEDIVLEINSGGLYRPAKRIFPQQKWFDYIHKKGIQVTVSSDAHNPENVGYAINNEVVPALKSAGYTHLVSFNKRKKQFKPITVHK